jgi:hypothetical protein
LAQANQQKHFDDFNRAAMLSRLQNAARPTAVQQMGMVSFIYCVTIDVDAAIDEWTFNVQC